MLSHFVSFGFAVLLLLGLWNEREKKDRGKVDGERERERDVCGLATDE